MNLLEEILNDPEFIQEFRDSAPECKNYTDAEVRSMIRFLDTVGLRALRKVRKKYEKEARDVLRKRLVEMYAGN